jgi:hypothetical protein
VEWILSREPVMKLALKATDCHDVALMWQQERKKAVTAH